MLDKHKRIIYYLYSMATTKNNIIKNGSPKAQKFMASYHRAAGIKSRAQRSDAGKKRK